MSAYIPSALRRRVLVEADGRCAYCRCTEDLMGITFEIDHVVPLAVGGATIEENLCLSCPACNRYKADRQMVLDPLSGEIVSLYHPRRQAWNIHFTWSVDGATLIGLTAVGRATIEALHMNRPVIVQMRRYWVELDLHPPASFA